MLEFQPLARYPLGGTLSHFTLGNGIHVTVLGDGYPHADDYETQQRNDAGFAIAGTEQRATSWADVWRIFGELHPEYAQA
ncbi:hypothetical protein GCM10009617_03330 [Leifsonia poae]|uniref:Uncharacterized protein n=1 Tax=Leifsonia poae TaxID=110933 RepID=A0A9W6LYE1_9MICO|nr:hypothetical protein GCM10017584_03330 [Leifsonia poae]